MVSAYQRTADWGYQPEQSNVKAEFAWSRLSYNSNLGSSSGYRGYGYGRWATWQRDYPKADRQFLIALNRLTRIQGRPTEQVVNLDSDDIFNYPWVYAVQVQTWSFTDEEAKRLREYLLKGGFLMVDDFHGTADWENFMNGMRQVFPTVRSKISKTRTKFSTCCMTWTTGCRCPASSIFAPGGPTRRMAM